MNPLLIGLIGQLAQSGIQAYANLHAATTAPNPNIATISALIPVVTGIYTALTTAGSTLQQAQSEGWTDDDPRWGPVFAAADKALADAEARLT